jgi:hypothetical protein
MSTNASPNGKPPICRIPGCGAQTHGNLLCRVHYDEERYELTTQGSAEDQAAAEREQRIEGELCLGCVSEWQSPHGTNSMFANDEERRGAWDERKDKLMEERYTGTSTCIGRRPWAWWEYESGRPELRKGPPGRFDFSRGLAETPRIDHEHEVEVFTFLAEGGHLTDAELEKIADKGREAKERIGTDSEQKAAQSPDYGGDKLAAACAEAVLAALKR